MPAPLLKLSLLRVPTYRASVVGGSLFRIGIGAIPFLLPLMLQLGFNMTAFEAGLVTLPNVFGALGMKICIPFLLRRFEQLPDPARQDLCARASRWLADHHMFEEATQLAFSAGQAELAYDLAERCMYELILRGQMGRVLEWLDRLPDAELARRPRLRLATAWALALGGRLEKAHALVAHATHDGTQPWIGVRFRLVALRG